MLGIIVVVIVAIAAGAAIYLGTRKPTATGIVVRVDAQSLTDVRSFDLRTADGRTLTFRIGQLDMTPPAFNPQHLSVHAATAEPVVVTYEERDGQLFATRLVDGP